MSCNIKWEFIFGDMVVKLFAGYLDALETQTGTAFGQGTASYLVLRVVSPASLGDTHSSVNAQYPLLVWFPSLPNRCCTQT